MSNFSKVFLFMILVFITIFMLKVVGDANAIMTYMVKNKEWLFSGIGITLVAVIVRLFNGVDKIISFFKHDIITVGYSHHVINLSKYRYRYRIKWNELTDRLRLNAIEPMRNNNWIPDLVLCIGRGGAIIGSIIASTLKSDENRIPIFVLNVVYKNSLQELDTKVFNLCDFTIHRRILLVDSNIETGASMVFIRGLLSSIPNREIRVLALVWAPPNQASMPPNFAAYKIDHLHETRISFPWYIQ